MSKVKQVPVADIVINRDLYPRAKTDYGTVLRYQGSDLRSMLAESPIEVNQDNILIDGRHRLEAAQLTDYTEVPVVVTETASDGELYLLAIRRNSKHGRQLEPHDKRACALRIYLGKVTAENVTVEHTGAVVELAAVLAVSKRTIASWLQMTYRSFRDERDSLVRIARKVGNVPVADIMAKFSISESTYARIVRPQKEKEDADRAERDRRILADARAGMIQEAIARKHGVSQGRVSEIIGRGHVSVPAEVAVGDNDADEATTVQQQDMELANDGASTFIEDRDADIIDNPGLLSVPDLAEKHGLSERVIRSMKTDARLARERAEKAEAGDQESERGGQDSPGHAREEEDGEGQEQLCSGVRAMARTNALPGAIAKQFGIPMDQVIQIIRDSSIEAGTPASMPPETEESMMEQEWQEAHDAESGRRVVSGVAGRSPLPSELFRKMMEEEGEEDEGSGRTSPSTQEGGSVPVSAPDSPMVGHNAVAREQGYKDRDWGNLDDLRRWVLNDERMYETWMDSGKSFVAWVMFCVEDYMGRQPHPETGFHRLGIHD